MSSCLEVHTRSFIQTLDHRLSSISTLLYSAQGLPTVFSHPPTLCVSPLWSWDGNPEVLRMAKSTCSFCSEHLSNCMCYLKPQEQFVLIYFYWCVVSSALRSEPWGYPLQTIRLKTASWLWQEASWDCRSTPVCWNMPSWSGDWGESLNPCNATERSEEVWDGDRICPEHHRGPR